MIALCESSAEVPALAEPEEDAPLGLQLELARAWAEVGEAREQANALESEECQLEEAVGDRVRISTEHAGEALELQSRAEELQAAVDSEAGAIERIVPELGALESRALMEERRCAHEQRLRTVHVQVAEAGLQDVRAIAADYAATARREEDEEAAWHAEAMRKLRASNARRLAAHAEAEASRQQAQAAEAAESAARNADERAARIVEQLRARHAADSRRLAAERSHLACELQELRGRIGGSVEDQQTSEAEVAAAQFEARQCADAAAQVRTAAARAELRCSSAQHLLQELILEDAPALADAEHRGARRRAWQRRLEDAAEALQGKSEELKADLDSVEASAQAHVEALLDDLACTVESTSRADQGIRTMRTQVDELAARAQAHWTTPRHRELRAAQAAHEARASEREAQRTRLLREARQDRDESRRRLYSLKGALEEQAEIAKAALMSACVDEEQAQRSMWHVECGSLAC